MEQHTGSRRGTRKPAGRDCDGLWDWNLQSNRIHFAPGWLSLVGCQDHELGNTPEDWFQLVHPDDRDRLVAEIAALRTAAASEFELRYRLRHKDASYRWMLSRGLVIRNDRGEAMRLNGTQTDVTVEAVTDPQTGLPNRLLLLDRLTQSIERTKRSPGFQFALLLIDLGRPAGPKPIPADAVPDPLLNAVARRLESSLRVTETTPRSRQTDLVARMDGELFAVLLDGMEDLSHAPVVAERLLAKMLSPFVLNGRELRLSASIGIAVSATGYDLADEPMRDAGAALHRAQVLGGSHYEVFDTGALISAQASLQLEGDLDAALQRREFQVVYQPVVSIASRQVVGFEALVRWQHPVRGAIATPDFIALAEKTGFIVRLGHWILQEACRQLRHWQDGLPQAGDLWVSVNLSAVQLRHPALVGQLEQALRDSAVPARGLVLELTESIAMDNPAAVTTLLMRLRALGVRISVDDFGTGYSSLAYLRQFPVDALKIDRSFVQRIQHDKDTVAIVASITALGRQLGLHIVAEGVENEEQVQVLQSLDCDSAQGYVFAEPLDGDAAAALLRTGLPARQDSPRESSESMARGRWMPALRGALLAGATVAVVMLCAGVVTLYQDASASGAGPRAALTIPQSASAVSRSGPVAPAARGVEATSPPEVATAPKPEPQALAMSAPPPAARSASFPVTHVHRVGRCRGRLEVTQKGVEFVPDARDGKDAFSLAHADFLHTLERKTLTIRSSSRNYRFEAQGPSDKAASETEIARVADAIARFRSR
jgi:diguanylate cyclase (GGDEF)-like protein